MQTTQLPASLSQFEPFADMLNQIADRAARIIGEEALMGPDGEELYAAAFKQAFAEERERQYRFENDADYAEGLMDIQFGRALEMVR